MPNYYKLTSFHGISEYISLGHSIVNLGNFNIACIDSSFQLLDKKALIVEIPETKGTICPDFIYEYSIPLISQRFKDFFDNNIDSDNLFYKKIILSQKNMGIKEDYWLALPPRIDCLNRNKSVIETEDDEDLGTAVKLVISDDFVGRYKIFKISGVANDDIIITEDLAENIKAMNFEGVRVIALN